jgi:hypothetical protein
MSKTYTIPCRECGALWAEMCFCAKSDALWKAHKERERSKEVPPPPAAPEVPVATPVAADAAPMAMVPVPVPVPVHVSIYAPEAAKYAQLTKEDPTNPLYAHLAEWYADQMREDIERIAARAARAARANGPSDHIRHPPVPMRPRSPSPKRH